MRHVGNRRSTGLCFCALIQGLENRLLFALPYPGTTTAYTSGGDVPQGVAVGDMNGDSKPDVILAHYQSGNVSILLNTGNRTFAAPRTFVAGTNLSSVAVADLNADGKLDVVVAGEDMAVFWGSGTGTVNAKRPKRFGGVYVPQNVTTGDFNRDGLPDLAVTEVGTTTVTVVLNTGNKTFGAAKKFAAGNGPSGIVVADVNKDKKPDLVVSNVGVFAEGPGVGVNVLLGTGKGTFAKPAYHVVPGRPVAIAAADLNGDKYVDLVTVNHGFDSLDGRFQANVLLNLGTASPGKFAAVKNYAAGSAANGGPQGVALGDVNGDGKLDIVTGNYNGANQRNSILTGRGDGTFTAQQSVPGGLGLAQIVLRDIDGDGGLDIIAAASDPNDGHSGIASILFHT